MTTATTHRGPGTRFNRPVELPRRWHWLLRGFRKYAVRYVRKHFHALRVSNGSAAFPPADEPVLIVLNHPSWWDPMIGLVLSNRFSDRDQFAAIDAVAVQQYGFFKRLGFVGVDTASLRGGAEFLRTGTTILSQPGRVFWVTAQGGFSDVRERPLDLRSGVGHLAARLDHGFVVPLALEYAFWDERTPEAFARFGEPIRIADHPGLTGRKWTQRIEDALTQTLDALNAAVRTRDPANFIAVVEGRTGIGGVYDRWRRLKAWVRGKRFDPSHAAATRKGRT
jgi:1-acyl-sn-glycerol-3-phosphate acyltransferase